MPTSADIRSEGEVHTCVLAQEDARSKMDISSWACPTGYAQLDVVDMGDDVVGRILLRATRRSQLLRQLSAGMDFEWTEQETNDGMQTADAGDITRPGTERADDGIWRAQDLPLLPPSSVK